MSEVTRRPVRPVDGTENMPLPGFYPCLTLQLNVTLHQNTKLGKFVLVIREPNEKLEIQRTFADLDTYSATIEGAAKALGVAMADMRYLQGLFRD